jgi:hypothetical protein
VDDPSGPHTPDDVGEGGSVPEPTASAPDASSPLPPARTRARDRLPQALHEGLTRR